MRKRRGRVGLKELRPIGNWSAPQKIPVSDKKSTEWCIRVQSTDHRGSTCAAVPPNLLFANSAYGIISSPINFSQTCRNNSIVLKVNHRLQTKQSWAMAKRRVGEIWQGQSTVCVCVCHQARTDERNRHQSCGGSDSAAHRTQDGIIKIVFVRITKRSPCLLANILWVMTYRHSSTLICRPMLRHFFQILLRSKLPSVKFL